MRFRPKNSSHRLRTITPSASACYEVPEKEEASIIGRSTLFRGQVRGQGSFTVRGQVEGTVGIDGLLRVEQGGQLNADTRATGVRVAGSLVGSVQTIRTLSISSTGQVEGNARAGQLLVEKGGILQGRVVRGKLDA